MTQALVVVGMHRSGTSAMARALSLLGAKLPRDLMPSGRGNTLGHWESQPIVDLNREILAAFGAHWTDVDALPTDCDDDLRLEPFRQKARALLRSQFPLGGPIILKDPRIGLLANFWDEALHAEGYIGQWIVMVRHPLEVAASLRQRDGITFDYACRLWTRYMASTDAGTLGRRRLFCLYDDLIDEGAETLDRIVRDLDLSTNGCSMRNAVASLDARQRHHRTAVDAEAKTPLPTVSTMSLWLYMQALARDGWGEANVSATVLAGADTGERRQYRRVILRLWWRIRVSAWRGLRLVTGCKAERRLLLESAERRIAALGAALAPERNARKRPEQPHEV